jgi:tetratricopeptide (TPR) repeat protein
VCGILGDKRSLDVFGGLERLAEQSLAAIGDDAHGDTRFTMLETIREYALEKLEERGETMALRDRHASAFLAFATAPEERGTATAVAAAAHTRQLDRFEDEHDNLRTALESLIAAGDTERASALVFALWRFWHQRGHLSEARTRVGRVLAMPQWPDEPTTARLRALEAAGGLAYWAGDLVPAGQHYQAAVEVARGLGDEAELANAFYNLFFARRPAANSDEWIDLMRDDDTSLLDDALEIWTRLGDEEGMGRALWGLSEWYGYRGDYEQAEASATRSLEIFERIGDPFWVSWSRFTRAVGRVLHRDIQAGADDLVPTLQEFWLARDVSGLALVLAGVSTLLLMGGREVDGYEVGGAVRRLVSETGVHLAVLWPTTEIPWADPDTADPDLAAAFARGATWSREEAVERAGVLAAEMAGGSSAAS